MRHSPLRALLPACCVLGCGGGLSPTSGDARAAHDGTPDAFSTDITETGTVAAEFSGTPISGAQVCANGLAGTPCTTTDGSGNYSLLVAFPAGDVRLAQVTSANGYLGRESDMYESSTATNYFWDNDGGLYSGADATTLFATQAGFEYPVTTTGFILVQTFPMTGSNTVGAATATISPAVGSASGPIYGSDDSTPEPTLTSTVAGPVGSIYFGNLTPGTYSITVTTANGACSALTGSGSDTINGVWPPTNGASVDVGVSPNALTSGIVVTCP